MNKDTRSPSESGFTLIEVVVVAALLLPMLAAVITTGRVANGTIQTNEARASVLEDLHSAKDRLGKMVRAATLTSLKRKSAGAWVEFQHGETAATLRFQSASGIQSMNASVLTPPRTVKFVMDAAETDNDKDDDGDGLVDEGDLMLTVGLPADPQGHSYPLVRDVEQCTFNLTGRLLTMTLRCGRRDTHGNVARAVTSHKFYIRNN